MSAAGTVDPRRTLLPHVIMAVFTVLVFGAIALSLVTAPPVAQTDLQSAAKATLDASGFRLVDVNSATYIGPVPQGSSGRLLTRTNVIHVLYQAPDRVRESGLSPTGQSATAVVAGSRHFVTSAGRWTELRAQPGLGGRAVDTVLSPLRVATGATDVVRRGDVYAFVPSDLRSFITTILGTTPGRLTGLQVGAVVRGGYLVEERVSAVMGTDRLGVDLTFSVIGAAPPVTLPVAGSPAPG